MRCKRVRSKLVAYLDGELKEKQELLIKEHLSKCVECKREADLLSETFRLLKNKKRLKPSEDFEVNFWRRISSEEERHLLPQPVFGQRAYLVLVAAVAAALIIGVSLGSFMGKITSSQTAKAWEEKYVTSSGLDSFQDFSAGSVAEIYFSLGSQVRETGQ